MKFKQLYFTESFSENNKQFKALKNILSGFAQKDPSSVVKKEHGYIIKFSPIGSWTTFLNNVKNNLPNYRFVENKSDGTQYAFKSANLFFWTIQDGKDALIYVTDKSNPEKPELEQDEKETEEVQTEVPQA